MSRGLEKALAYFRTKKALAQALGVEPMTVTQWFQRGLPAKRAKQISDATGGAVPMHELLPELFENASE